VCLETFLSSTLNKDKNKRRGVPIFSSTNRIRIYVGCLPSLNLSYERVVCVRFSTGGNVSGTWDNRIVLARERGSKFLRARHEIFGKTRRIIYGLFGKNRNFESFSADTTVKSPRALSKAFRSLRVRNKGLRPRKSNPSATVVPP